MSRSSDHINNLRSPKTGFETGFDIGSDYLGSSQLQRRSTPEIVTKIDVEVSDSLQKIKAVSISLSINLFIYLLSMFYLSSIYIFIRVFIYLSRERIVVMTRHLSTLKPLRIVALGARISVTDPVQRNKPLLHVEWLHK